VWEVGKIWSQKALACCDSPIAEAIGLHDSKLTHYRCADRWARICHAIGIKSTPTVDLVSL
jgi:hypothetical protein